jgi:glycosyltransferase involved in cell wall biosynthesis
MRLAVDAIGVRPGSAAIVIENVLAGWRAIAPDDEIVVLADGPPQFSVPDGVAVWKLTGQPSTGLGRIWAQSVGVRAACRRFRADALLSAVTASGFLGAPCSHGAILYDLRHEVRPSQFSRRRRFGRRLLYGWSFRRADALFCISGRTRGDLLARRPHLREKAHVALLGADHAAGRRAEADERAPYVLAFGHFENKNLNEVLAAWAAYGAEHDGIDLRVCGLPAAARAAAERRVTELGIADRVELLPWLADDAFESVFAGAAAVLFPSDFEGFGLPALEALLLGIPVVISSDPALLEVTG